MQVPGPPWQQSSWLLQRSASSSSSRPPRHRHRPWLSWPLLQAPRTWLQILLAPWSWPASAVSPVVVAWAQTREKNEKKKPFSEGKPVVCNTIQQPTVLGLASAAGFSAGFSAAALVSLTVLALLAAGASDSSSLSDASESWFFNRRLGCGGRMIEAGKGKVNLKIPIAPQILRLLRQVQALQREL